MYYFFVTLFSTSYKMSLSVVIGDVYRIYPVLQHMQGADHLGLADRFVAASSSTTAVY